MTALANSSLPARVTELTLNGNRIRPAALTLAKPKHLESLQMLMADQSTVG
ncbi:MAG: hypothetical protein ACKODX_08235 [Gemmata sp.]